MNRVKPLYLYKSKKERLEKCKDKYRKNSKFFETIKSRRIGTNSVRIYRNDRVFNTLSNKKKIFLSKNAFIVFHDSLSDMKSKVRQVIYTPYKPNYLARKIPLFFDGVNRMIKNNTGIICNVKVLDEYKGDINDKSIIFTNYKNKM